MTYFEGIFLGLLQGLSEFLPISSSGHLILAEKLLGVECNLFFNVMLHIGTLFAVFTVLWRPITTILRHPIKDKRLGLIALASVPTFLIAGAIKLWLPDYLFYQLLPAGFLVTAILLFFTAGAKNRRPLYVRPILPIIVTGIAQGFAVLPGISRSGATIAALSAFDIKREQSAEFSFLLSIPVIFGGGIVEAYEAIVLNAQIQWLPVLLGVVFAYLSGVLALRFLLSLLKRTNLKWFSVYMLLPFLLSVLIA